MPTALIWDGKFCNDSSDALPCREVFQPFSLKLRNTKAAKPGDQQDSPSVAGEETRLLVPFINVSMDSREFHVLMDVINNVGLSEVRPF